MLTAVLADTSLQCCMEIWGSASGLADKGGSRRRTGGCAPITGDHTTQPPKEGLHLERTMLFSCWLWSAGSLPTQSTSTLESWIGPPVMYTLCIHCYAEERVEHKKLLIYHFHIPTFIHGHDLWAETKESGYKWQKSTNSVCKASSCSINISYHTA